MSLGQVAVDGDDVYWIEGRPAEGGRQVIVRWTPGDGEPVDVLPAGFSARTTVHEYGGGVVRGAGRRGVVRQLRRPAGVPARAGRRRRADRPSHPRPAPATPTSTSAPTAPGWRRCASATSSGRGRQRPGRAAVDGRGRGGRRGPRLLRRPPVVARTGALAWLSWDHPNMPWDGTELWVDGERGGGRARRVDLPAPVGARRRPALGVRPHRLVEPLPRRPDRWWRRTPSTAAPTGSSGQSTYAVLPDGTVVAARTTDGLGELDVVGRRRRRHPVHLVLVGPGLRRRTPSWRWRRRPRRRRPSCASTVRGRGRASRCIRRSRADDRRPRLPLGARAAHLPHRRRARGPRPLLPARQPRLRGPGRRAPAAGRDEPRRADLGRPLRAQPRHPVLHQPGPGRGRRRLRGQLRLRAGLPAPPRRPVGRRRPGRLRQRRPPPGRRGPGRRPAHGHPGRERGRLHHPVRPHLLRRLRRRGQLLRRGRPGRRWPPTPTSSSPATSTAWWGRGRRRPTSTGPAPPSTPPTACRRRSSSSRGWRTRWCRRPRPRSWSSALRAKGLPFAYVTFEGEQHGFRKAETIVRAAEAELWFYGRILGFEPADDIEPVPISNW